MAVRSQTQIMNDRDFTSTETVEYDTDQTTATVITPTSGKTLQVVGVKLSTEGAGDASQSIRLFLNTTGNTVFEWFPGTSPNSFDTGEIFIEGAADEVLSLTSTIANTNNFFIAVNYREN